MRSTRSRSIWLVVLLVAVIVPLNPLWSKPDPSDAKPSVYAPVADLAAQLDKFMKSLDSDLADPDKYGDDQQGRVGKDANTVAALALILGKHDKKNKYQATAPAVITAARQLGDNADDYKTARAELDSLKKALAAADAAAADAAAAPDADTLTWEPVADIVQLMKQVPVVNNSLRRGVTGRRFKRSLDKNAGYAATLAAIAQASMHDTDYCEDEDAERDWIRICAEMRDAAAAVNRAVRKGDQDTAKQGLARLVETCDACHEQFR